MSYKKCWCLIIGLIVAGNASGVGSGGLVSPFRVRNRSADVYVWAKETTRDSLRSLISFGCALGVFKYLRSTKKAGKLVAFVEASGIGTTLYQLLGIMRKYTINYLARLCPWVARKRTNKLNHTQALFRYVETHNIKTVDQLPDDDQVRNKTATKMMERLCEKIHYGGLDADINWVDKLMVKDEPDFVGDPPGEVRQDIDYIKDPMRYENAFEGRRGLLLLGAPGGGKTTLAKLIAFRAGCPFIEKSPAAFMNTFVGTGPNALKGVFENAEQAAIAAHKRRQEEHEKDLRRRDGFLKSVWHTIKRVVFRCRPVSDEHEYIKPTILCLNELDAIGGQRGAQSIENQERISTLDQLFNSMDDNPHVFLVGTSNRAEEYFDDALRRDGRMGAPVVIPLPDASNRFKIIKYYMSKVKRLSPSIQIPDFEYESLEVMQRFWNRMRSRNGINPYDFWHSIVDRTEGFNGNQLRHLFNNAGTIAGDEYWPYLGKTHLERALNNMRRTTRQENAALGSAPVAADIDRLGTQVAAVVKDCARDLDPDEATMDGEPQSEF